MIKLISKLLFISILIISCAHTIKPNENMKPSYDRINSLSKKRRAIIYYKPEYSGKKSIKDIAKMISINNDSTKFYCINQKKDIVLSTNKINRIVFNSGSDGGIEGIFPGILFGLFLGYSLTPDPLDKYPNCPDCVTFDYRYIAYPMPLWIVSGYLLGRTIGKYNFIINETIN